MAQKDPQLNFRCPAGLKTLLELAAAEENRSMNAEIVHRLLESFKPDETLSFSPITGDALSKAVEEALYSFFEAHPEVAASIDEKKRIRK